MTYTDLSNTIQRYEDQSYNNIIQIDKNNAEQKISMKIMISTSINILLMFSFQSSSNKYLVNIKNTENTYNNFSEYISVLKKILDFLKNYNYENEELLTEIIYKISVLDS